MIQTPASYFSFQIGIGFSETLVKQTSFTLGKVNEGLKLKDNISVGMGWSKSSRDGASKSGSGGYRSNKLPRAYNLTCSRRLAF